MRFVKFSLIIGFFVLALGLSQALAATTLPNPTSQIDGVTLASQYGDFYTFPASLMIELKHYNPSAPWTEAEWNVVTGVGGLDLLIYTGPRGQDNDPMSWGPAFPDPIYGPSGGNNESKDGTWGNADGSGHSAVTVDRVLQYIQHYNPGTSIPVFSFDMVEPQGEGKGHLQVWGAVRIVNPTSGVTVMSWTLNDTSPITPQNPHTIPYIYAPDELLVDGISRDYLINNHRGGGKMDYVVYAPTMRLDDPLLDLLGYNYLFLVDLHFMNLEGGAEDVFLTTRFAAGGQTPPEVIPEPATMLLWGAGLVGAALLRRRKR